MVAIVAPHPLSQIHIHNVCSVSERNFSAAPLFYEIRQWIVDELAALLVYESV